MGVRTTVAEIAYEKDADLAECPVWDERNNLLCWVDITGGLLYRFDPAGKSSEHFDIGRDLGSFALRESGGAILATRSGFAFYDFNDRSLTPIENPEPESSNSRFNDGKCDPEGRFWSGTLTYDFKRGAGSLYCLDTDLKVKRKLQNVTIPNGMAWDTGKQLFYFIDSPNRKIYSFRYDRETGSLSDRSVIRAIDESMGFPDGMTIDREGALWVALYEGSRVIRINPESGDTLFSVLLPVPRVTSCTFGGADLNELYITTARENMPKERLEKYPLSGSLFRARVPFRGSPAVRFAG
ncbi:MAG: SMP-30/gluconolactonase/LRE family protein [Balneolaceae bacterium]|nr:SMP-30/gluconolactonase/LRE family protein [Balneolaceae bacterium]